MNPSYELKRILAKLKLLARKIAYWGEYISWRAISLEKFRKRPEVVEKVLIVNYGAIGDIFSSLRTAYNLSVTNKNVHFYFLTGESSYNFIKNIAEKINIFPIKEENLLDVRFDLVILFSFFGKIKNLRKNLGFIVGNEYSSISGSLQNMWNCIVNRKIPPLYSHKIRQEVEICKLSGLKMPKKLLSCRMRINKNASDLLKKNGIEEFAIVHPFGRNFSSIIKAGKIPATAWPLERFAEIADYLIESYGLSVIITGAEYEKFMGDSVINYAKNKKKIFNFSGLLDIPDLPGLVSSAKTVVTIDTSMVHIAEFTGTPVVVLFGPTFFEEVGAYGDKSKQINIAHPEKCIRDRKKGASYDKNNSCMCSISIDEVKNAVDRVIKRMPTTV